uniref:G-protein coupled receptors family 1 profile domain-containing protein n=1 Tax=Plectus sambesii TaxID=2011161 RepID=A0A914W176_9BILA
MRASRSSIGGGRSDALTMPRHTDLRPKLGLLDDSSRGRLCRLLPDAHAGGARRGTKRVGGDGDRLSGDEGVVRLTMGWNVCSDPMANSRNNTDIRPYYAASCTLVLYVAPVLCSLGFILNCVCISIFISVNNKGYFRKISLVVYLIALCFFDALQLMLSIFVLVLPAAGEYIEIQYPKEALLLYRISAYTVRIGYPLLQSSYYATVWMITLICVQRYQAVCHPSSVWRKRLQNVRNSKTSISLIIFAAIGLNLIRFWEFEWKVKLHEGRNITEAVSSALRQNTVYNLVQEGIVYGLMAYVLPTVLLVILNVNIVSTICRTARQKYASTTEDRAMQKNEHRNALMTVTIFIVFFACHTLAVTLRVLTILVPDIGVIFNHPLGWFLEDLSNLLVNFNSLLNPLIYFCFTRRFRDLFFEIRRGRLSTTGSLSSRASIFSQLTTNLTGRMRQPVTILRRDTRHESLTPLHHELVHNQMSSGRRQLRTMVSSYM